MEIQQDFRELLSLFNKHNVDYIIVGSYALAYHGAPRYTGDIDIYIRPSADNAEKILSALTEFGFGSLGLCLSDFTAADRVIQLGVPPVRIDILTSITGVEWEKADKGKIVGLYGDLRVYFLGKKEYISNKKATGRKKDIADIEALYKE